MASVVLAGSPASVLPVVLVVSRTDSSPRRRPVTSQPRRTVTVGRLSAALASTASSCGWQKKLAVGQPEGPLPDQSIRTSGSPAALRHS
ncbi:hypothetical protein GCM10020295_75560 [Streptomyces cinereospinus]